MNVFSSETPGLSFAAISGASDFRMVSVFTISFSIQVAVIAPVNCLFNFVFFGLSSSSASSDNITIVSAFKLLDVKQRGSLSSADFQRLLLKMNLLLDDDQLYDLLEKYITEIK